MYKKNRDTNKTPLENYTTELLVGILESDNKLLDEFVNKILLIDGNGFSINSQVKYILEDDVNCIIDMVVGNEKNICFVENKVGSLEGDRQLERYSKVLKLIEAKKGQEIHLRYCTKYYDRKEVIDIEFQQYRWRDIYQFFEKYKQNLIIQEYLSFLRSENMDNAGNFSFQDLIVMKNVNTTIKKMDECLDMIKPKLIEAFCAPYEYDYERLKQISKNNQYVMWCKNIIGENAYSEITVGFGINKKELPIAQVFIYIEKGNSEFEKIKNVHSEELAKIFDSYYHGEESISYTFEKAVSDFISFENQNEVICKWFAEKIAVIAGLKNSINIMWK